MEVIVWIQTRGGLGLIYVRAEKRCNFVEDIANMKMSEENENQKGNNIGSGPPQP